jgi:hypothetical protein
VHVPNKMKVIDEIFHNNTNCKVILAIHLSSFEQLYTYTQQKSHIVQIVIAYNKVSFQVISKTLGLAKIDDDNENHQHYRDDMKTRGTQVSSQTLKIT